MSRLYTIKHGKGYVRTGNSYRSNLDIVNKETLVYVAKRLGVEGVAKSHTKERMAKAISGYVLSHPEECLKQFSVKELLLLKDFADEGADTSIVRPNRKYYDTLRELLFVSAYHDSLGEFLSHLNDHDYFDSVLAVQDFYSNANVVESKNGVVTLYATVVYVVRLTGKILYRSTEPIEVHIDTHGLNNITIPNLPVSCVSKFSTETEVMNYSFGVLTIEGEDEDNKPYVVSII